jgi:hypothetical protein
MSARGRVSTRLTQCVAATDTCEGFAGGPCSRGTAFTSDGAGGVAAGVYFGSNPPAEASFQIVPNTDGRPDLACTAQAKALITSDPATRAYCFVQTNASGIATSVLLGQCTGTKCATSAPSLNSDAQNTSCSTVAASLGSACTANADCPGYSGLTAGTLACCPTSTYRQKTCQPQLKDWAGVGYCPSECVGAGGVGPGTCPPLSSPPFPPFPATPAAVVQSTE